MDSQIGVQTVGIHISTQDARIGDADHNVMAPVSWDGVPHRLHANVVSDPSGIADGALVVSSAASVVPQMPLRVVINERNSRNGIEMSVVGRNPQIFIEHRFREYDPRGLRKIRKRLPSGFG
jgi:hypothetical protein